VREFVSRQSRAHEIFEVMGAGMADVSGSTAVQAGASAPTGAVRPDQDPAPDKARQIFAQLTRRVAPSRTTAAKPAGTAAPVDPVERRIADDIQQLDSARTQTAKREAGQRLFRDVADALRHLAGQGGGDAAQVRQRIINRVNELKARLANGPGGTQVRELMEQAQQQVLRETPELRSLQIQVMQALRAQETLQRLGTRSDANAAEWDGAERAANEAVRAVQTRTSTELAVAIASAHLDAVKARSGVTPAEIHAAETQLAEARAGTVPLRFTDANLAAALRVMRDRYQEGLVPTFTALGNTIKEVRARGENARATMATGIAARRQESDPVTATLLHALLPSSGPVQNKSAQEQLIEQSNPILFGLMQRAGIRIQMGALHSPNVTSGGVTLNGQPLELTHDERVMAGHGNILGLAGSLLRRTPLDADTRALVDAAVEARRKYTEERVAELHRAGNDKEALATLDLMMRRAFTREEADALWRQYGEPVFTREYFDGRVRDFLARYGNDRRFTTIASQWLRDNFGRMPQPAAGLLVDAFTARTDIEKVTVIMGSGQFYTEFSRLVEQAPDRAASVAAWYTTVRGRPGSFRNANGGFNYLFEEVAKQGNTALSEAVVRRLEDLARSDRNYSGLSQNLRTGFNAATQRAQRGQTEKPLWEIFQPGQDEPLRPNFALIRAASQTQAVAPAPNNFEALIAERLQQLASATTQEQRQAAANRLYMDLADSLRHSPAQGDNAEAARQRIIARLNEIKAMLGRNAPQEIKTVIDRGGARVRQDITHALGLLEQRIPNETAEQRSLQMLVMQALTTGETLQRTPANSAEWERAKAASDQAEAALQARSLGELGIEIARAHLTALQRANAPEDQIAAARAQLQAAEKPDMPVTPTAFTNEELTAAVATLTGRYGAGNYFQQLAAAIKETRDNSGTARAVLHGALTSSAPVPQGMDHITAAFIRALQNPVAAEGSLSPQMETIRSADPLSFALIRKAQLDIRMSPLNTIEATLAGQPVQLNAAELRMANENNLFGLASSLLARAPLNAETRALMSATVEERRAYTRTEVARLLALHTPAGDRQALAVLERMMKGAFSPNEAGALWTDFGAPHFNQEYFNGEAERFLAAHGNDFDFARRADQWIKDFGTIPIPAARQLITAITQKFSALRVGAMSSGRNRGWDEFYVAFSGLVQQAPDAAAAAAAWYTAMPGQPDSFRSPAGGYSRVFRVAADRSHSTALSAAIVARAQQLARAGKIDQQISRYTQEAYSTVSQASLRSQVERLNRDIFNEFEASKQTVLPRYFDSFLAGRDVTHWIAAENTPAVRNMVGRMLGLPADNQAAANAKNDDEDWYVGGPNRAMIDLVVRGLIQEAGPNGRIRGIPSYLAGERVGARNYSFFETRTRTGHMQFIDGTALANAVFANQELIRSGRIANFSGRVDDLVHADWRYANFRDFQDHNKSLPDDAVLYLPAAYMDFIKAQERGEHPVEPATLLRVDAQGHVQYTTEAAGRTTPREWAEMIGDWVIGAVAVVGGVVLCFVPGLGWVAAAAAWSAVAGGMGWGAYRTIEAGYEMAEHGQSLALSNPNAQGLYLSGAIQFVGAAALGAGTILQVASRPMSTLATLSRAELALNRATVFLNETGAGARLLGISRVTAPVAGITSAVGGAGMTVQQTWGVIQDFRNPNSTTTPLQMFSEIANIGINSAGMFSGIYAGRAAHRYNATRVDALQAATALERGGIVPPSFGHFAFEADGSLRFIAGNTGRSVTLRHADGTVERLPGISQATLDFLHSVQPEQLAGGQGQVRAGVSARLPRGSLADVELTPMQRAILPPDQIPLVPVDLMPQMPVEHWSAAQFHALNEERLLAIPAERFGHEHFDPRIISDTQWQLLHPDQIQAIRTEVLPLVSDKLRGTVLHKLSDRQFQSIPGRTFALLHMEDVLPRQMPLMTRDQQGHLRVWQIQRMTYAQFLEMTVDQLKRFTRRGRMAIRGNQIIGLPPEKYAAVIGSKLDTEHGETTRTNEMFVYGDIEARYIHLLTGDETLPPGDARRLIQAHRDDLQWLARHRLTPEDARWLILANRDDPQFLSRIHPDELPEVLSPADFGNLTPRGLAGLNLSHLQKIPVEYLVGLGPAQQKALRPLQAMYVVRTRDQILAIAKDESPEALDRLQRTHPESIRTQLKPEDIKKLGDKVVALNLDHVAWLSPEQALALTDRQLGLMHPLVLGSFTNEAKAAMATRRVPPRVARALALAVTPDVGFGRLPLTETVAAWFNQHTPRGLTGLHEIVATSPMESVVLWNPLRGQGRFAQHGGLTNQALLLARQDVGKVMLLTGFNVDKEPVTGRPIPETDGPPGTALAAKDLLLGGKEVVIVTDAANARVIREIMRSLMDADPRLRAASDHYKLIEFEPPAGSGEHAPWDYQRAAREILETEKPDLAWSIELPGRTAQGTRSNMRGVEISGFNRPLDEFMLAAQEAVGPEGRRRVRFTMGTIDGGNESGSGNVESLVPRAMNGQVMASQVTVDALGVASTSNTGAQAVTMMFLKWSTDHDGHSLRPLVHTAAEQTIAIEAAARAGAVDGVTRENKPSVDGMTAKAYEGLHSLMIDALDHPQTQPPIRVVVMDSSSGGAIALGRLAWGLQQQTGRPIQIILGLDHDHAPYGLLSPDDVRLRTNNVLRTIQDGLEGDVAPTVIVMACNTACTSRGFEAGIRIPVINLVDQTAIQMRQHGGRSVVSFSTTATELIHAYEDRVLGVTARDGAGNITAQTDDGLAWRRTHRITEVGGSAFRTNEEGVPLNAQGQPVPSEVAVDRITGARIKRPSDPRNHPAASDPDLDLATIVNNKPLPGNNMDAYNARVQRAVEYYVQRIFRGAPDADTVWLTCTHYPELKGAIEAELAAKLPNGRPKYVWLDEHDQPRVNGQGEPVVPTVINPMDFQVTAAVEALKARGLQVHIPEAGQKLPSPRPILVTSAGKSERYKPKDIHELVKNTMGRDDVILVESTDFEADRPKTQEQILRQLTAAKGPGDGTLHGFMRAEVDDNGVPRYHPIEGPAKEDEYQTAKRWNDEGFKLTDEYNRIFEAIQEYNAEMERRRGGSGGPRGSGDIPPIGPIRGGLFRAGAALRDAGPVLGRDVFPIVAVSTAMALGLPKPFLMTLNGLAWVERGIATLPYAIAPGKIDAATGNAIRYVNWMTYAENSWHPASFYRHLGGTEFANFPYNDGYMISNYTGAGTNSNALRGGDYPIWLKNVGVVAGNLSNVGLLTLYSIPAAVAAWHTGVHTPFGGDMALFSTFLFGGGAATTAVRHFNADYFGGSPVSPLDLSMRIASALSASGLILFGGHYLAGPAYQALDLAGGPADEAERRRREALLATSVSPVRPIVNFSDLAPQTVFPPQAGLSLQGPGYSPPVQVRVNVPRGTSDLRRGSLYVHSVATIDDRVIGAFEDGAVLDVLEGPRLIDNRVWLRVRGSVRVGNQTRELTGWVVGDRDYVQPVPLQ
jgi:glutamate racemase